MMKAQLNDIVVVDIKLGQQLIKNHLALYVRVNNLFDANYEEAHGFPQAGRTIWAGISVRLP